MTTPYFYVIMVHIMNNTESSVYFVADFFSNAFKIGKADDAYRRIGELQTGNPNPLTLLHSIKFQSSDESFYYEKKYHRLFKHLHLSREWFKFDQKILNDFFLNEVKIGPKSKRDPLVTYTVFGEETVFDIRTFPRCFFYPYLVAQIKQSYENSTKLTLPFRTMQWETRGKQMLLPYSAEIDRVFISTKKHQENLLQKKFEEKKALKQSFIECSTLEAFL